MDFPPELYSGYCSKPFGLDEQKDDVLTIPDKMFFLTGSLYELYEVFFLSFQPGIELKHKISPVIRSGLISLINYDNTFYIDGFAYPGNSGSPLFLKPSAIRFDGKNIHVGKDQLGGKFIGIIGEYLPYQEMAISTQTGRPRVMFEEHTGLSRVWGVNFINDIAESDFFIEQINKVKGSINSERN